LVLLFSACLFRRRYRLEKNATRESPNLWLCHERSNSSYGRMRDWSSGRFGSRT
jgi:hypothetical protein